MRIMVFDVAAESGGALTILKEYYDEALKDKENEWFFVLSKPLIQNKDNVLVILIPWIKKSWFHRLFFDLFNGYKLIKKYKIDNVLSLQNTIIPKTKVKQTIYLHQALPFVEKRFKLKDEPKLWIYQNIISRVIFNSIKKADKVIVQTNWIKRAAVQKTKTKESKFIIKSPKLLDDVKKKYKPQSNNQMFFYPAAGFSYKNHEVIVDACRKLKDDGVNNYEVIFTLSGNEGENIKELKSIVDQYHLPIRFVGQIKRDEVFEYYSKSILIFPSYIETFGLPLLEAREHGTPIIASNTEFSKEILDNYENKYYFNPNSSVQLSETMKYLLSF